MYPLERFQNAELVISNHYDELSLQFEKFNQKELVSYSEYCYQLEEHESGFYKLQPNCIEFPLIYYCDFENNLQLHLTRSEEADYCMLASMHPITIVTSKDLEIIEEFLLKSRYFL